MFEFISDWQVVSFYVYLGLLLFTAKLIKEKVPFLSRIIIPSALIAGFIGLALSDGFLNVINISDDVTSYEVYESNYNEIPEDELSKYIIVTYDEALDMDIVLDLDNDTSTIEYTEGDNVVLKKIITEERSSIIFETVYHALAIGFIALTLRREENKTDKKVWSTGMVIVITYLFQALIGVTVVVVLFKDLFLGAGLLLPLGFGQGPGLATTQGYAYATNGIVHLPHGGALGASIASMGFLAGGIVGVIALNYLARKNNLVVDKFHREESLITENIEIETINEIRVFDALTMQLVIIFLIYGCVYLTLAGLETLLYSFDSSLAGTFAGIFHGFNFLIGIVYALIYRQILNAAERKGKNVRFLTNNYVLSNISSVAFNFMIIASVLTITNAAVETYYLLILAFAVFGTLGTVIFVKWISKKIYAGPHEMKYFLGMFGMLTGTASTGLALLKGVDKDFESPVAEEMVVGSGTAISMALPLFALLTFPTLAVRTGENIYNVLVFVIPAVYGLLLLGILLFINRKK
jgi:ESS family glutamate:Na+ symporter